MLGDRDRLRQIVDNLLSNVRSHTPCRLAGARQRRRATDGRAVIEVVGQRPGLDARTSSPASSSASTAPTRRARARAAVSGSGSRSSLRSRVRTAAASASAPSRTWARSSGSSFRSRSRAIVTGRMPPKKSVQLSGVVVAQSAVSSIDPDEGVLMYRGYDIADLAEHSTYEEVAYLLLHGELPSADELDRVPRGAGEARAAAARRAARRPLGDGGAADGHAAHRRLGARLHRPRPRRERPRGGDAQGRAADRAGADDRRRATTGAGRASSRSIPIRASRTRRTS